MPKTKLESVVFSAMMVFCMVFSMTCYTGALRAGGVTYGLFILVVQGADGLHGRPGGDAVRIPAPRRRKPGLFPTLDPACRAVFSGGADFTGVLHRAAGALAVPSAVPAK